MDLHSTVGIDLTVELYSVTSAHTVLDVSFDFGTNLMGIIEVNFDDSADCVKTIDGSSVRVQQDFWAFVFIIRKRVTSIIEFIKITI